MSVVIYAKTSSGDNGATAFTSFLCPVGYDYP